MNQTLEFEFQTVGNRPFKIIVENPKANVTAAQVQAFAQATIGNNVIQTSSGNLKTFTGAVYIDKKISSI
ncbi:MAG: DUF2922 domain-containing protein [Bacilli bacterium]